ncbi:MAG: GAF domain-containing protein [Verrucomicrobiota bacterium]
MSEFEVIEKVLVGGLEEEEDWVALLDAVLAVFDCVTGTVHTMAAAEGPLTLQAQRGIPEEMMAVVTEIPLGKGIAGAAAANREAVQLCNLQEDLGGVANVGARKTEVSGSLAVPMLDGDELKGVLGIGKFEPYEFGEEETDRLWAVAEMVARMTA